MLIRAFTAALLLTTLVGCAHSVPTAPVAAARALRAAKAIAHASFSGVDKPMQQRFTIMVDGSTSLKLTYFWSPWSGQGFTTATVDGVALTPTTAGAYADELAASSLGAGVDGKIVQRAIAVLRDFAAG
ncbi:MAG: hypothetical protein JWM80_5039 [Cyanobacteria bacterium RYN_339]|nr:hypothetical protein [Cyanobacteria bacterium RYN_339]